MQCYKNEPMARRRQWVRFAAASQISSLQRGRVFVSSLTPIFAIETPQQLDWTSCNDQLADPVYPLPPSGDDLREPYKRVNFRMALLQMPRRHCKMCRTPLRADDSHAECVSCSHCKSFSLASQHSRTTFFSESYSTHRALSFSSSQGPVRKKQWGRGFERTVTSEPTLAQCLHASSSPQREYSPVLFTQHEQRPCEMDESLFLAASDVEELLGSVTDPALLPPSSSRNARLRMDEELIHSDVNEFGLEWSPPEEPSRSRLDEWFLPGHHQAPRQCSSPFFPKVHDELTKSWHAPYSSRIRPSASAALTSIDGTEAKGYECLPLWMSLWPRISARPRLSDGRRGRAIHPSCAEPILHSLDAPTRRLDKRLRRCKKRVYYKKAIIDLRHLNHALVIRLFRMITLKQILICPGNWFMSLDLKDAYIHIQVAPITDDSWDSYSKGWRINTRSSHLGCPWLPALLRDALMRLSPLCDRWEFASSTTSTIGSFWPSQRRFQHRTRPSSSAIYVAWGSVSTLPRAYCHPANEYCSWAQLSTQYRWQQLSQRNEPRRFSGMRLLSMKGPPVRSKLTRKCWALWQQLRQYFSWCLLRMRPIQFWLKQRVPSMAWHHGRHRVMVTRACVSALAHWKDLPWLKHAALRYGTQKEDCLLTVMILAHL